MGRHKPLCRVAQRMRRDVFDVALARRAIEAYIGEPPHPVEVLSPLRALSPRLALPLITEVELDASDGVTLFDCLFPISIGALPEDWGLTQDGQAYFDRVGPAPGENARLVPDGLGGLEITKIGRAHV